MDLMLLRVFQRQVGLQCRYLLLAAEDVNKGLQQQDIEYTFYALQNLLNAAANISKALWGTKGKRADARKELRDSIGIADDSPLRDPDMRNNFEHFDERLDKWWKDSSRHMHVDFVVGPKNMVSVGDETDQFRIFDPDTMDMVFWGQAFNIKKLIRRTENHSHTCCWARYRN